MPIGKGAGISGVVDGLAGASAAQFSDAQVSAIVSDLAKGENLGFFDPASSAQKSGSANDFFFNTADSNAMYRATAAGQAVTAFTKVTLPGGGGDIVGEASTAAEVAAITVVNGKYIVIRDDIIGTGTAAAPQYRRGFARGVSGAWTQASAGVTVQAPHQAILPPSETVTLATLPASTWTDVPAGTKLSWANVVGVTAEDAEGNEIPSRLSSGKWQVFSAAALSNVRVILWS